MDVENAGTPILWLLIGTYILDLDSRMLGECLRAVTSIDISFPKRRPCQYVLKKTFDSLTLESFSGHTCDVLATKINARKAKHWAIDHFIATETKHKDWEKWKPGTIFLNKTQFILLETSHLPLTQEVSLPARRMVHSWILWVKKTFNRNDTAIHFVFKLFFLYISIVN